MEAIWNVHPVKRKSNLLKKRKRRLGNIIFPFEFDSIPKVLCSRSAERSDLSESLACEAYPKTQPEELRLQEKKEDK